MHSLDRRNYAHSLTELSNWNMTAVVRTHYRMRQHTFSSKLESLSKMSGVDAVFGTLEPDRDFKISPMVHLHLLLNINSIDAKRTIAKGLKLNRSQIQQVEPIRGLFKTARYVTKLLNDSRSHHDIYINHLTPRS